MLLLFLTVNPLVTLDSAAVTHFAIKVYRIFSTDRTDEIIVLCFVILSFKLFFTYVAKGLVMLLIIYIAPLTLFIIHIPLYLRGFIKEYVINTQSVTAEKATSAFILI